MAMPVLMPVLDQLCERYWNEWDQIRTNDPQNPNNFRALENICLSPRLSAVTSIIVLGLGNGGTYQEQVNNCNNRLLYPYLEYSQKVFFTQIVVARNLANLLKQRFRIEINIWAYDPQTTPYTWDSLQYLGIQTIQNNTTRDQLRNYITPGSLVYDVTRSPNILRGTVDFTWDKRHTPPAAVITGFFALAGGNNGMEVDAAFRRKYYFASLMNLPNVASSQDQQNQVDLMVGGVYPSGSAGAIQQTRDAQIEANTAMRRSETQRVLEAYYGIAAYHNRLMDEHAGRIEQLAQNYLNQGLFSRNTAGRGEARSQAERDLVWNLPTQTNSYVYDTVMILMYRKSEQTANA